ncbi:hypothetical protein DSM104329_03619 [Capillimicrobium parvum]|uniref:TrwC relaxase domain-containing protein n=1 Tax=Capillimicrobium parvum TaxID=2884022 RepID=A0A9E6XZE3_9ACTN|nr:hypothetical protein DSM104329_03619 [Capillimicrobium parvum]
MQGFDLTFSAPKSVSVLFAAGGEQVRRAVVDGHEAAVRDALGYLEREAVQVRRGAAGAIKEHAGGLIAGAYRHRTSRAGDPQLHTHVVAANLAQGADVNRPGVLGDFWPWKVEDGVHVERAHSWQADDASVFDGGAAGGGADGALVAGRDGDDARGGRRVADQLSYGVESVRTWVKQADIDDGARPSVTTTESERVKDLEQEVRP